MSTLEKRLIALSGYGINILHADGHRWIVCQPTYYEFDFDEELRKRGIILNNKIYGGVIQALDIIDECLELMNMQTLEEWYDSYIDEEFDIESEHKPHNRIDYTQGGKGGLF